MHGDHDQAECARDAPGRRCQPACALLETELDPRAPRGGVEDCERADGVDLEPGVGEQEPAQCLAQLDRAPEIGGGCLHRAREQAALAEPRAQTGRRVERFPVVEEVPGIHEIADQLRSSHELLTV